MDGWQTAYLGNVLAVLKNGLNCKQDKSGQGQKISRIESISQASFDIGKVGYAEISYRDKSKFKLSKGDILFSHINSPIHVGKTAVFDIEEEVYHGVNLLLMRPTPVMSAAYLELYLKYLFEQGYWLSVCKQSVNQASVNQQDIARVPIAYPNDLAEQQRIVAILDEAFEGIATAKANTEKNLQNAREILASAIRQVFDSLGKRYESRSLGSVCKFENGDRGKNYPGKEHRVVQGIPFINAGHLTPTGVDLASMDYITPERFALLGNGKIQSGDILFCLRGSLGKYASVGDLTSGAIASSLVILRPTNELDHGYLLSFLSSTLCSEQIEAYKGGSAQPNLGAKDLKQFELPLPPLEMQQLVSDRVMELQESTFELLNVTNKKLAALDELKKSLLHQAFSDQL